MSYVSNKDESVRVFKSDVLEFFTHIHPLTPHVLYVPTIGWLWYLWGARQGGLVPGMAWFVGGVAIWSIKEYLMHRFVFHFVPRTPLQERFMYLLHGIHHDYPNDSKRLVFPPALSIPLSVFFYVVYRWALGPQLVLPFFSGVLTGYLVYDSTHFLVHHVNFKGKVGLYLKERHLRHHYKDGTRNFGVSSPLWDVVFGTLSGQRSESAPLASSSSSSR